MSAEQEYYSRMLGDLPTFAKHELKIKTKAQGIVPFVFNEAQMIMHEKLQAQLERCNYVRAISLKGRQFGISTYVSARHYHKTIQNFGLDAVSIAHDLDTSSKFLEQAQLYNSASSIDFQPHVKHSNKKELVFDQLNSSYRIKTAGNRDAGHGLTSHLVHASECAYWPDPEKIIAGLMQSIGLEGTEAILESTANGVGTWWHKEWQKAQRDESIYEPIFLPWYIMMEYSIDAPDDYEMDDDELEYQNLHKLSRNQMYWRKRKIMELGLAEFNRLYPTTPEDAFAVDVDGFIQGSYITAARGYEKERCDHQAAPVVIGIDPSGGCDRTSMVWRQGDVVHRIESWNERDREVNISKLITKLYANFHGHFDRCFIDLGYDPGICAELQKIFGHERVQGVMFGSTDIILDRDTYANNRSFMWGQVRDWLYKSEPTYLPSDCDSLQADLVAPNPKASTSGKILLESKEEMKKRGIASPDEADALALTFAKPVMSKNAGGVMGRGRSRQVTNTSRYSRRR